MTAPERVDRRRVLNELLDPARVNAAEREAQALDRFCDHLRVPLSVDSLCLYLTWRTDLGDSARLLRRRLAKLNLAARLNGCEPWTSRPEIRRYLRGLHRQLALVTEEQRADPLYLELVGVLVEHVMAPTLDQRRDHAAMLLSAQVQKPATALARLRWTDVHWTKHGVRIDLPVRRGRAWITDRNGVDFRALGGNQCLVAALRRLREKSPPDQDLVFGRGKPVDARRVRQALENLYAGDGDIELGLRQLGPNAVQLRDRALLVVAYGAALRTYEAIELRVGDVTIWPEGLVVAIPGRQKPVGLPTDPGTSTDPTTAWRAWMTEMQRQGCDANHSAFPYVNGPFVSTKSLGQVGLSRLIQRLTLDAALEGRYSFSSLRTGMIRTAIRRDEHAHAIATHTDLHSLQSLRRHERRETVLSRSIAGQVGL